MTGPQHYLQHPEQVELELSALFNAPATPSPAQPLGLQLHTTHYYPDGKWLRVQAPALPEELSLQARVVGCDRCPQGDYLLKLAFPDQEQLFRARMLEQICQISLQQQRAPHEDPDQQALDWIEAEAAHFPPNGL
ncbi:hypothetical protein [Marinobacterium marinum]|uniref:PilZ domain-containing protein n=1 Tax=Marinobacterium marinum TaxID=2756129 RepID=A0A7W1WY61_9GAMM|nr:hypothetical protein [Marinobacterium marinum]MBA4502381.1 hypothetical protein [Marinobacterium marinum]